MVRDFKIISLIIALCLACSKVSLASENITSQDTELNINKNITQLQSSIPTIDGIIAPYSPDHALSFIQNLGYHPSEFDMQKFSRWFRNNFIGFTKDQIGFDAHTSKPITYNYAAFDIYQSLDFGEEYHAWIDRGPFPLSKDSVEWFRYMVIDIYTLLQKPGSFINAQPYSRIRNRLSIKDEALCLGTAKANGIDKEMYAISPTWDFYVRGQAQYGNHPVLLKGGFAWCAGHISISNGKITFLSNDSGHYRPHAYHTYTFVEELNQKKLFAEGAELKVYRGVNQSLFSVREFLQGHVKSTLKEAWGIMIQRRINEEREGNYRWLKTILDS